MDRIRLGMTDLHVSPICFGTWQLGGDWGRFDERDAIGRRLEQLAGELGTTVSALAIAWTLAGPAVHVAIVGARRAAHIEDSVGAAELRLDDADLAAIDAIVAGAVAVGGPTPES